MIYRLKTKNWRLAYAHVLLHSCKAHDSAEEFTDEVKMYIHTVVAYVYVLLFYACDLLQNCKAQDPANEFTDEVKMWVYEEDVHGQPLTQLIPTRRSSCA